MDVYDIDVYGCLWMFMDVYDIDVYGCLETIAKLDVYDMDVYDMDVYGCLWMFMVDIVL